MRARDAVIGGMLASAAAVGALSAYGAAQVMRPRRCEHRDDPTVWGLSTDVVNFTATDGTRLVGWLSRSRTSGPAVIVLHGHGANRHTSLVYGHLLFPDYTVLLPDLRGHGESAGSFTSVGYLEQRDVIGAVRYLMDMGYGPIGLLGISMGAATALLAAAASPLIAAVVADSSFAALRHAVREGARLRGYPRPLTRPLAYLSCQAAAWHLRYPMRAGDPLGAVSAIAPRPLLIIHGESDTLILVEDAYRLYEAAGNPKDIWVLPGVEHARALEAQPDAYRDRVRDFFKQSLGGSAGARNGISETATLETGTLYIGEPAAHTGTSQMDEIA
jgi:fermentation-respiration switch protein FrsA (DUF1100 family)